MTIDRSRPIVIFDGVCNMCNASVNFVMERDRAGRFLFASNQSDAGIALLEEFGVDPSSVASVYLVEGDRIWSKSAAAWRIARGLTFPWGLLAAAGIVPAFLADRVYDLIAQSLPLVRPVGDVPVADGGRTLAVSVRLRCLVSPRVTS